MGTLVTGSNQRQPAVRRTAAPGGRRPRKYDNDGILPVLARAVREVESAVERGRVAPPVRAKVEAIALLAREERARVRNDATLAPAARAEHIKRLDGIAVILGKAAVRHPSLLSVLAENAEFTAAGRSKARQLVEDAGVDLVIEPAAPERPRDSAIVPERQVVPQSVVARQLANPFLAPDFSGAPQRLPSVRRLATWELLGPLFSSFEDVAGEETSTSMALPEPSSRWAPGGRELMRHQAQLIAAAQAGHRTFLLADEPGLGKTAQALLAAQAANAYPLLVVVPSVVKTNWARESAIWTPNRLATVVHGDGETVEGFADIVVANYEILDRHLGWMGNLGFRGMVVDEAHFIKNKSSQRSQHVLELSERIRSRTPRPLLMALTGTPLINDIEDFRAIWQFLGWIDDKAPRGELMHALEETGLTPADLRFYPAARQCVVDMGIVRRRKADVAADIPARRIADIPVELDDTDGRSIRKAEQQLAQRMLQRYDDARMRRTSGSPTDQIDHDLVRTVARWELKDAATSTSDENVFAMMRRIGRAKATLAADYAAQLARSAGKVVFFAKHVDVMDAAEALLAKRDIRYASIRGDQTPKTRQQQIDSFTNDPEVAVAVCSLTAAGVGLNLQVASNIVLAELSWTDAEQTQAIDRSHRIGQTEPVTAWRILAAQTIDTKIAELIGSKAGLVARALDGSAEEVADPVDVQLEALVELLTGALTERAAALDASD